MCRLLMPNKDPQALQLTLTANVLLEDFHSSTNLLLNWPIGLTTVLKLVYFDYFLS